MKETKAPAGYNKLTKTFNVTITSEPDEGGTKLKYSVSTDGNDNTTKAESNVESEKEAIKDTVKVLNTSGSKLPETGGMGTTTLYIIGGILVAASAVLMMARKRMSAE